MKKVQSLSGRVMAFALALVMSLSLAMSVGVPVKAADANAFAAVFDASYYANRYADLKAAYGTDVNSLLNHFIAFGMKEGRQANEEFNVQAYKARYADLQAAFGEDLTLYYFHYINNGKAEGRNARAGATTTVTTTTTPTNTTTTTTNIASLSLQEQVIALVNADRAANGLPALTPTPQLMAATNARAIETGAYYSHTRPDGSSCFTIFEEYGVQRGWAGENIAYGQRSPQEVETAWMNSPGHRANILNEHFNHIGVGVYHNGYRYYWVQMFTD